MVESDCSTRLPIPYGQEFAQMFDSGLLMIRGAGRRGLLFNCFFLNNAELESGIVIGVFPIDVSGLGFEDVSEPFKLKGVKSV